MDSTSDTGSANIDASSPNSREVEQARLMPLIKEFRREIDGLIQKVSRRDFSQEATQNQGVLLGAYGHYETEQVRTKLTEAKMWAGKILEALGSPFPKELADKAQ